MRRRRGTTVALASMTAALAILGLGAVVLRDRIVVERHLHRLLAGHRVSEPSAYITLEESLRFTEEWEREQWSSADALVRIGAPAVPRILSALRAHYSAERVTAGDILRTRDIRLARKYERLWKALADIGRPAAPYLMRALLDEDKSFAYVANQMLEETYPVHTYYGVFGSLPPEKRGVMINGNVELDCQVHDLVLEALVQPHPSDPPSAASFRLGPEFLGDPVTLLELLRDDPREPGDIRAAAAEVLSRIRRDGGPGG